MSQDLKIVEIKAYPTSFPVPPEHRVALGIGTAIKRDAVVVKVTTAGGLVGWGESHHGRAHTAVAKLIGTSQDRCAPSRSKIGCSRTSMKM